MSAPVDVLAAIEREMVKRSADRTAFARANAPKMIELCEQVEAQAIEVHAAIAKLIADGWNMVATARHTGEPIDPERLAAALARASGGGK